MVSDSFFWCFSASFGVVGVENGGISMEIDLKHDAKETKNHKLAKKMEVSAVLRPQGNVHPKSKMSVSLFRFG